MKEVYIDYTQFLANVDSKKLLLQYAEDTDRYTLFAVEQNVSWQCVVLKGTIESADFIANRKTDANKPLEYRSVDGLVKTAPAKFSDVKSFLVVGSNGVVSLTASSNGYFRYNFANLFTLSGVDVSWYNANLGDYIDFEVGIYTNENQENTFQQLNQFGNNYKIYKDGNRTFDVPAVKDIPPTVTIGGNTFTLYVRIKCVNVGPSASTVIINLMGWQ